MSIVSFYRLDSGEFTGQTFQASSSAPIELNTPAGCGWIAGRFDPLSQRVNLETRTVVDWRPPAPDADHEWDADIRRWRKRREAREREAARRRALEKISELEASQARALREVALGDTTGEARARLETVDAAIAALRTTL